MPNNNQSEEVERIVKEFLFEEGRKWLTTDGKVVSFDIKRSGEWIQNALTTHGASEYARGKSEERERLEAIFKEHVPPHAMNLEDSVWLKRLLNKAFNHDKNV